MQFIQQNQNLRNVQVDTLKISKGLVQQYINSVQTKYCGHFQHFFELDEVVNQFNNYSKFICGICQQSAYTIADLNSINLLILFISLMEYQQTNIVRKDIYLKPFFNVQIRDQILQSYLKNEIFDYSLNQQNGNIEFQHSVSQIMYKLIYQQKQEDVLIQNAMNQQVCLNFKILIRRINKLLNAIIQNVIRRQIFQVKYILQLNLY
ncbi:unnamed protein product [Paramecium octaurelia]|uniref:Uncharacterized protein n=1 Tax=Paramecium octaurelia TaxID=43137 RepID=A0A8S1Y895_PAROT|nr:unnamed protein product [Paramecium octaurelia]